MTTIGNDTVKRCRIDSDEVAEITVDGDTVFFLDADLVLDLFNTGAISADTLGLYHNTVFDSLDVSVGGNTNFTAHSVSQTTSGSNFSITVNGNYQPTSESITINGNGDTISYSQSKSDGDTINVDGKVSPSNESVTISPNHLVGDMVSSTDLSNISSTMHRIAVNSSGEIFVLDRFNAVWKVDELGNSTKLTDADNGLAVDGNHILTETAYQKPGLLDTNGNLIWEASSQTGYDYLEEMYIGSSSVYAMYSSDDFGAIFEYDKSTGSKNADYTINDSSVNGITVSDDGQYIFYAVDSHGLDLFKLDSSTNNTTGTLINDISSDNIHSIYDLQLYDNNKVGLIWFDRYNSKIDVFDFNGNNQGGFSFPTQVADQSTFDDTGTEIITAATNTNQYDDDAEHIEVWDGINNQIIDIKDTKYEYSTYIQNTAIGDDYYYVLYGSKFEKYSKGVIDPSFTIGNTSSSYNGELDSSWTTSISLNLGSNSVSLNGDISATVDWTEDHRTQNPSVTIDGSTVSHSGPLANGETETGNINISSTGTYTASVSTNGEVTVDVDWTERNVVKDVDFTFNGVTESVTGPILNNEQSTLGFGVSDIIDGDNSVDVTAGGNSNPDLQLTFLLNTKDAMALTDFEPNWDYDEKGDNVLLEYWFDVSNVDAPAEAVEGDPFSVDATIENIGITPVQQDVVMTHTGETLTKTKNLNDKESINVTFDTVINSPGEQTIVVESPQESASDLIQILSKYQLDITIDGASNINTEINSDYSTNVYPSFSPSVYLNGTLAGTATNNSGENIDVSASAEINAPTSTSEGVKISSHSHETDVDYTPQQDVLVDVTTFNTFDAFSNYMGTSCDGNAPTTGDTFQMQAGETLDFASCDASTDELIEFDVYVKPEVVADSVN